MRRERATHASSNGPTAGERHVGADDVDTVLYCGQDVLSDLTCAICSMSLHLGNEVFDVYKAPLQGDHNHLFIRQGTGLQGQAVFKTKLTFR